MSRLRVGLVGAGLVGQAEHAFYLWEERDRFELVALADASASVRAALSARYAIRHLSPDLDGLLSQELDALVIAAPDPFHADLAVKALQSGLHVLCEKPLALTLADCDRIKAARDASGQVLQVAYMKRHDPAYKRALQSLPERIEDIRLISVEVNDPDHAPFVAHLPMTWPVDLSAELRTEARERAAAQLRASAGGTITEVGQRALGGGFLSSLVRDVAVVHGMLLHLGHELPATADHGRAFGDGRGVQLGFGLAGGGRVSMTHLNLPGVPDYIERMTVYGTDRILELVFPSPYLRHFPTRLTVKRGSGREHELDTTEIRSSYEEAFREQLRAFHAAVTGQASVSVTLEMARRDIELLVDAFRKTVP